MVAYDDAMDMAHDFVTRRISQGVQALGVSDTLPGLNADFGTNGEILLYRVRETINGTRCEPTYLAPTGDAASPIDGASLEQLDREIRRHARRTLRQHSLAKADVSDRAPPWSFTMHRLALGWFRHVSIDPVLAVGGPLSDAFKAFLYFSQEKGFATGTMLLEDGRMDFNSISTDGDIQLIGHGRPALLIEREVPETLVAGMTGRLVSEVIDHPAIRRAGPVRIEEAMYGDGLLTLALKDVQDFIRRPPVGTDRRWNAIPFDPRPGGN